MGLDRGDVRSGARLGNADAGHRVARYRRRQEFAAHLVRSDPNRASAGVAMSVCTPIAIGTPPQRIAPSSSAIISA
jgi:hypothetical protein